MTERCGCSDQGDPVVFGPCKKCHPEPEQMPCDGRCLSGADIGVYGPGIAYAHPDCPAHGDQWIPKDNEWSRRYVADHPGRFPPEPRYMEMDEDERRGH